MKTCNKCGLAKDLNEFHIRSSNNRHRNDCKKCFNKACGARVIKWRQQAKEKLVQHFGAKCLDCTYTGPPFMFDFDHRDPTQKEFGIGEGSTIRSYSRLLIEATKCDLVCANCHRMRTHKQRCDGCKYCGD
jgi:hypothetical protein